MRPVRVTAVALTAVIGLALGGCASDDEPASPDAGASSSPSAETSASPDDSGSGEAAEVGDFAEVDGFTLVELPKPMRQAYESLVSGAPELEGFEGRLVEKDGDRAGLIMRIEVDSEAAAAEGFEDQFLPGFASGIAGSAVTPEVQEINGVNVVKIETPGGTGTAYAWLEGAIATVLVFESADDAQAYAEGALA